jgi:hypothetical protein
MRKHFTAQIEVAEDKSLSESWNTEAIEASHALAIPN